jgi:hypothetical protein
MASRPTDITNSGVIRRSSLVYMKKLSTIDPTIKFHPSTNTNNISFKGNEIMIGGSIIIPMDINTEATTRSTTRKGT